MSKKVHTRVKRRRGLTTSKRHYGYFHNLKTPNRPKTFKTEDAANARAKRDGLKDSEYVLVKVKKGKKFKIETKIT